jgi:high affinity Mn2+ porin
MASANKKAIPAAIATFLMAKVICAQTSADSMKSKNWTHHFQLTVIAQKHAGFHSAYAGENSLADSVEPTATSLTSTLFVGRRLWKGAAVYFNPEVSGGKGLSFTKGVAGALNGETYRVGATEPQVFIARAYLQQTLPLGKTQYEYVPDDINQVSGTLPANRLTLSIGKFAISDFFDDNSYSKDPRTQFFNWSLWANGAWDYPADTKGYTFGVVAELIKPTWAVRFSSVAVPRIANFHLMEYNFFRAHSETIEFDHKIVIHKKPGNICLIMSNTNSRAPSYSEGLKAIAINDSFLLNVISGNTENNSYGGKKFGIGVNIAQQLTDDLGFFSRVGWNDGRYASWAFTEIDKTLSVGLSITGNKWRRLDDVFGMAIAINGISNEHRGFLRAGGYGFIVGDGKLNYGCESIIESYYNAKLSKFSWLTFDYQFVNNPAYNKDRGPVHVFGLRLHIAI